MSSEKSEEEKAFKARFNAIVAKVCPHYIHDMKLFFLQNTKKGKLGKTNERGDSKKLSGLLNSEPTKKLFCKRFGIAEAELDTKMTRELNIWMNSQMKCSKHLKASNGLRLPDLACTHFNADDDDHGIKMRKLVSRDLPEWANNFYTGGKSLMEKSKAKKFCFYFMNTATYPSYEDLHIPGDDDDDEIESDSDSDHHDDDVQPRESNGDGDEGDVEEELQGADTLLAEKGPSEIVVGRLGDDDEEERLSEEEDQDMETSDAEEENQIQNNLVDIQALDFYMLEDLNEDEDEGNQGAIKNFSTQQIDIQAMDLMDNGDVEDEEEELIYEDVEFLDEEYLHEEDEAPQQQIQPPHAPQRIILFLNELIVQISGAVFDNKVCKGDRVNIFIAAFLNGDGTLEPFILGLIPRAKSVLTLDEYYERVLLCVQRFIERAEQLGHQVLVIVADRGYETSRLPGAQQELILRCYLHLFDNLLTHLTTRPFNYINDLGNPILVNVTQLKNDYDAGVFDNDPVLEEWLEKVFDFRTPSDRNSTFAKLMKIQSAIFRAFLQFLVLNRPNHPLFPQLSSLARVIMTIRELADDLSTQITPQTLARINAAIDFLDRIIFIPLEQRRQVLSVQLLRASLATIVEIHLDTQVFFVPISFALDFNYLIHAACKALNRGNTPTMQMVIDYLQPPFLLHATSYFTSNAVYEFVETPLEYQLLNGQPLFTLNLDAVQVPQPDADAIALADEKLQLPANGLNGFPLIDVQRAAAVINIVREVEDVVLFEDLDDLELILRRFYEIDF